MRICMFVEALGGGVLSYLVDVCRYLEDQGNTLTVVYTRRPETPDPDDLRRLFGRHCRLIEVPFNRRNPILYLRLFSRYGQLLRQLKPDVAHFHSSISGFVGRLLVGFSPKMRTSCFYTPHGYAFLRPVGNPLVRKLYYGMERMAAAIAPDVQVLAVSESEAVASTRLYRFARVSTVGSGVNVSEIERYIEQTVDHGFVRHVIAVGRLCSQKNPELFVRIAEECVYRRGLSHLRFIWVGDGEDRGRIARLIGALGLHENVIITGWLSRDKVLRLLSTRCRDSVYVHTALWEGLPVTVIESMYIGLPVICFPSPGTTDAVFDGDTGFIARTPQEFASKIELLIRQDEVRRGLTTYARQLVRDKYDIIKAANLLSRVYHLNRPPDA
ncbi:MAG: glycosyltransferase [Alicyclobacillus sp.]|nr:glycosyltransferase [Alicyclobacillus sp.]